MHKQGGPAAGCTATRPVEHPQRRVSKAKGSAHPITETVCDLIAWTGFFVVVILTILACAALLWIVAP